ncbi:hypothetical protein [Actinoplanes sp. HUAS TT8]|uniref:hypothetical protein n=1 Tax=Actinoplanes sp. HUAS TT8 TaxID=3447453 RepID=UPI003F5228E9
MLIAGTGRPALLLMAASGVVLAEWPLPEPMVFPDRDGGYRVSDNGDVTFLSGRRTVMAFHPGRDVRVLWRHDRDLGVPGRIDRLLSGEDGLLHALGKGHLVTFRFRTGDHTPFSEHPLMLDVSGLAPFLTVVSGSFGRNGASPGDASFDP